MEQIMVELLRIQIASKEARLKVALEADSRSIAMYWEANLIRAELDVLKPELDRYERLVRRG